MMVLRPSRDCTDTSGTGTDSTDAAATEAELAARRVAAQEQLAAVRRRKAEEEAAGKRQKEMERATWARR